MPALGLRQLLCELRNIDTLHGEVANLGSSKQNEKLNNILQCLKGRFNGFLFSASWVVNDEAFRERYKTQVDQLVQEGINLEHRLDLRWYPNFVEGRARLHAYIDRHVDFIEVFLEQEFVKRQEIYILND
jgi:hypothetical protein